MSRVEAVIFDLGKVLLDFDYARAAANLAALCRISKAEIQALIDQSDLLLKYERNQLSTEQFFAAVRNESGFGGDIAEFGPLFGDIFSPIEPMIELQRELRERNLPTYIFSNTNPLAVNHIRGKYSFFQNFDGYILSCEHDAMKPEAILYEVVERETGMRGAQLLYIDDRLENVEAGAGRGWQVIHHLNPEQTIAAARKLVGNG